MKEDKVFFLFFMLKVSSRTLLNYKFKVSWFSMKKIKCRFSEPPPTAHQGIRE